jgi:hypothetical protein
MKAAGKQLTLAKKKSKVTGYDVQSLRLTFYYFGPRIIATAGYVIRYLVKFDLDYRTNDQAIVHGFATTYSFTGTSCFKASSYPSYFLVCSITLPAKDSRSNAEEYR